MTRRQEMLAWGLFWLVAAVLVAWLFGVTGEADLVP